jgi:hypothetical protein
MHLLFLLFFSLSLSSFFVLSSSFLFFLFSGIGFLIANWCIGFLIANPHPSYPTYSSFSKPRFAHTPHISVLVAQRPPSLPNPDVATAVPLSSGVLRGYCLFFNFKRELFHFFGTARFIVNFLAVVLCAFNFDLNFFLFLPLFGNSSLDRLRSCVCLSLF